VSCLSDWQTLQLPFKLWWTQYSSPS
jgi:hypothetical protein